MADIDLKGRLAMLSKKLSSLREIEHFTLDFKHKRQLVEYEISLLTSMIEQPVIPSTSVSVSEKPGPSNGNRHSRGSRHSNRLTKGYKHLNLKYASEESIHYEYEHLVGYENYPIYYICGATKTVDVDFGFTAFAFSPRVNVCSMDRRQELANKLWIAVTKSKTEDRVTKTKRSNLTSRAMKKQFRAEDFSKFAIATILGCLNNVYITYIREVEFPKSLCDLSMYYGGRHLHLYFTRELQHCYIQCFCGAKAKVTKGPIQGVFNARVEVITPRELKNDIKKYLVKVPLGLLGMEFTENFHEEGIVDDLLQVIIHTEVFWFDTGQT